LRRSRREFKQPSLRVEAEETLPPPEDGENRGGRGPKSGRPFSVGRKIRFDVHPIDLNRSEREM